MKDIKVEVNDYLTESKLPVANPDCSYVGKYIKSKHLAFYGEYINIYIFKNEVGNK